MKATRKRQRLRLWLHLSGNVLIIVALTGLVFTLAPFLWSNFGQSKIPEVKNDEFSVEIPAIQAAASITPKVDAFNKVEYQAALEHGVAHAKGTSLPGDSGSIYLFAHSSGLPWEQLRTNVPFLRLHRLVPGDEVVLRYQGKEYVYRVRESQIVQPHEVDYLTKSTTDQLILQTCSPVGTDWRRLLVFADEVE